MIRVLMILGNLRVSSGVPSYAMNYFNNLDKAKIHMDFAVYSEVHSPFVEKIMEAGSSIFVLPSVKNIIVHLKYCQNVINMGNYDIIHDNTLHITIPLMICAKVNKIPVRILHSHNSKLGETTRKEKRNKLLLPLLRSMATNYVACSTTAGKAMFGNRKFGLIPNVIDSSKYKFNQHIRNNIRVQMHVSQKKVVATVGRTAFQKNPFFAMDIIKEVIALEPEIEYWWIGSGELDEEVIAYVKQIGIEKYVKMLGSREDVQDLYQAMDCFFLPSLFEGLPVTGVEAQAMGLPMVVADTVTNEMVYTDLVKYVSLDESIKIWAESIIDSINKKYDRKSYAMKLETSIFSDLHCGDKLLELYRTMLNKKE